MDSSKCHMRVNASNMKTPLPLDLKSYFFLGVSFVTSCQIVFSRMLLTQLRYVVLHMLRCAEHARVCCLLGRRSMRSCPASQSSIIPLRVSLQLVSDSFSHPGSMHIVMEFPLLTVVIALDSVFTQLRNEHLRMRVFCKHLHTCLPVAILLFSIFLPCLIAFSLAPSVH